MLKKNMQNMYLIIASPTSFTMLHTQVSLSIICITSDMQIKTSIHVKTTLSFKPNSGVFGQVLDGPQY